MLKILGRVSSINVRKVLWLCGELGLEYEREDWGHGFRETSDPAFLALNPNGLVPVLIDGDFVMWESDAIVRYLTRKHGRDDLYPKGLQERAIVEQWMNWYGTRFAQSFRYAFHALSRKNPAYNDQAQIEASIKACAKTVAILDGHLTAAGPYVTGPNLTCADILIGAGVNRWLNMPVDRPPCPAVEAYYALLSERPAYRQWYNAEIV